MVLSKRAREDTSYLRSTDVRDVTTFRDGMSIPTMYAGQFVERLLPDDSKKPNL